MGGDRITSLGEPTEPTDAVNRNYQHRRLTAELMKFQVKKYKINLQLIL